MAMSRDDAVPLDEEYFDYTWSDTPTFTDDKGCVHVALTAFHHTNRDLAYDPFWTNRRLNTDILVLGNEMMVF